MSETTNTTDQSENVMINKTIKELQNIQAVYKLKGKNYLKWSQHFHTLLKGKGKISHLTGSGCNQKILVLKSWDEEDSMIMAWSWNSMTPEISNTCMFLVMTKDIWDAVQQSIPKLERLQVYEVKVKTIVKTVTEYANQFKHCGKNLIIIEW